MDQNMDNQNQDRQAPPPEATQPIEQSAAGAAITSESRNMSMLCHLLGLFTSFIGPLIIWLIKKDDDAFINEQGKEALNFQITVIIANFIGGITAAFCVGFIIFAVVWIADIVFCILAAVATSKGEHYRYPVTLRLIS